MGRIRVNRNTDYTNINNGMLRDRKLSFKAKGILCFMLSLPPDWDYTINGLAAVSKEGRDSIRSVMQELEDNDYLVRTRIRDEEGKLHGTEYDIYDERQDSWNRLLEFETKLPSDSEVDQVLDNQPKLDNPTLDNPTLGKPTLDNPTQINKDLSNKRKNKVIVKSEDVDKIYKAYPTKCVVKGSATGKSLKDREKIKTELRGGITVEAFLKIIERYVWECKDGDTYMKNFKSFLNNLPDYGEDIETWVPPKPKDNEDKSTENKETFTWPTTDD